MPDCAASRCCRRAGYAGLRRTVAVALGNWGSPEAVPVLAHALQDAEPLVRAHAASALGRVGPTSAVAALGAALSAETDEGVIEELKAALGRDVSQQVTRPSP